jgi:hypothetical protein
VLLPVSGGIGHEPWREEGLNSGELNVIPMHYGAPIAVDGLRKLIGREAGT